MDPLNILSRLEEGHTNPPTDAELASAATDLRDALDAATSGDAPDLAAAKLIRQGLDEIAKAVGVREAAAEENRQEALKLREGIFDAAEGGDEDEKSDDAADEGDEADAEDKVAEPVAAGADFQNMIKNLRASAARTSDTKQEIKVTHGANLRPVGPASAYQLKPDAGFRELGELFSQHGRSKMGKGVAVPLVQLQREFPEDRKLGNNVQENAQRIADVMGTGLISSAPIAAAGGICGPGDVDHTHPICSERGRVVTPALPQFNAARGQLTVPPSISIGDLEGGVSVWTYETDVNPQANTKPCPALTCEEEITEQVDAVVKCVTVGNFQAKFSPEWWAANLEVLAAAHDREAEQKALTEIYAASSSIGTVSEGSTLWSFIQMLRNVVSADRSARRNWSGRYTAIADAYGRDQILNQLAANLGSGVDIRQSLLEASSILDGAIMDAGISNMIWTYDGTYTGSTHRIIGNHSQSGHLPPTDFGVHIFPEESFLFLDGGTLDLGTEITDSELNSTNDRQAFAETFEKVLFRGCSAFRGVVTIDASCGCGLTSI